MCKPTVSRVFKGALLGATFIAFAGCASGPAPATSNAVGETPQAAARIRPQDVGHVKAVQKLVAKARAEGLTDFYAVMRGSRTLYCWRDRNVGTLIPNTKCVGSAEEVRSMLRGMAEERHRLQEGPEGVCNGQSPCTGN